MLTLKYTGRLIKKKDYVVAYCPELDIYSQGDNEEEARRNLDEAVHILLDETSKTGTLAQVLKESGYELVCRKAGHVEHQPVLKVKLRSFHHRRHKRL